MQYFGSACTEFGSESRLLLNQDQDPDQVFFMTKEKVLIFNIYKGHLGSGRNLQPNREFFKPRPRIFMTKKKKFGQKPFYVLA
jgi:hypothetical protein